jgi:predicted nucleic acid-binding protein
VYLIDTMVLSELRLRQRDPGVVAWISSRKHSGVGTRRRANASLIAHP